MTAPEAEHESARRGSRGVALRAALRRYVGEIRRQPRFSIPAMTAPALGSICLSYLAPLAVARLAGELSRGMDFTARTVLPYILAYGGLMLVGELFWRIGLFCMDRACGRGIENLYLRGMDDLLAQDATFFHDNFAGSLTKRVSGFAGRFEQFLETLTFQVVGKLVPLLFACVVLWTYDPWLVFVLLTMIVITGLVVAPLIRRRQACVAAREEASAQVAGQVADTLSNMDTVRAFAAERLEAAEHRRRVTRHRVLSIRAWDFQNLRIDTIVAPMAVLTNALGLCLAIGLGGGARLGVEAVVVTFAYFTTATRVMFEFNSVYRRLEHSLTEAAQFTELLSRPPLVVDLPAPEPFQGRETGIRFSGVGFAHGGGPPLFTGLDLEIPHAAKVGLVGRSGGGKSTLSRLLLRLMDVDRGQVLIGGQDIARLRQAELRSLIAYVPQDPAMFHRSLRDNIAFARPGATDAEIRRAAEAAHVSGFADELPNGFDTLVGERGVKLSGGQRQRVALARAILRDTPILLLDEATSALDSESELLIQDALWRLMKDRTALVVAHRLSTVARMDQLVVLDHGRVVEKGTHHELLAADGIYAGLWRHQSGGFLTIDQAATATPTALSDGDIAGGAEGRRTLITPDTLTSGPRVSGVHS